MRNNTLNIEIDVETYIDMLEDRREEFWVKIPDCVMNYFYELLRDGCQPDPENASPMYVVDNIAVNGDYPLVRECYYKDDFVHLINECYNKEENKFDIWEKMDEIETQSKGGYAIVADDMEELTLKEAENSLEEFMENHSLYCYIYEKSLDDNSLNLYVTAIDDYIEDECKLLKDLFNNFKENSLLGIKNFEIISQNGVEFKIKVNCIPLPEDMYIIYSI